MSMTLENRKRVEREIVTAVITEAALKGYTFKIDNGGEEDETIRTSGVDATLKEMFATDDERVYFIDPATGKSVGHVYFVYGNDGWDVIADHSDKPLIEALLKPAMAVSDKYQ